MSSEIPTDPSPPMETEETTSSTDTDNDDDNSDGPPPLESVVQDDDSDDDDDDDDDPKEDAEVALGKAMALKEEGNNFFREQNFEKASRSYRTGVNRIKHLNKANSGDEQVKALLLTLQTNLSMMSFKLGKHRQSKDIATLALKIDPNHVKARYRRAVAQRKLGNTEEAMDDLKLALGVDPANVSVRKELASIQKAVQATKKAQKENLRKAFSKGVLNDDRVEDEASRQERLAREKKEKEEALQKRKQQWEDDCVSRMAKGEDAISYEDWDNEQIAKEKAAEEEATRKRKEDEKRRKEERKKAKAAAKKRDHDSNSDSDDDDAFTEKELAAMRGYKKTADGRITSYFSREQSAEEKAMLDIAPKPLSDCTPQPITTPVSSDGAARGSSWNHAGTWEEKDTTEWCKNHLEKRLLETKVEASGSDGDALCCSVVEVKDITGDASVAIVSGKKRYIFDLHCKVVFEIKEDSTGDAIAKGSLKLPDICSTSHDELEVEIGGWKKRPSIENQTVVNDCRSRIVSEVRESIKLWVQDFNKQY